MKYKTLPGIAALLLAIAFPAFWFSEFTLHSDGIADSVWENLSTLSLKDSWFLLVTILPAYICYALMGRLHEELNYTKIDVLLWILIGANLLVAATLSLDIWAYLNGVDVALDNKDILVGSAMGITAAMMVVFGIADIIIGIILLRSGDSLPSILKVFGAITLVQGVFELSVVFSIVTLVVYPLALIVLAVFFMREPETLEVV